MTSNMLYDVITESYTFSIRIRWVCFCFVFASVRVSFFAHFSAVVWKSISELICILSVNFAISNHSNPIIIIIIIIVSRYFFKFKLKTTIKFISVFRYIYSHRFATMQSRWYRMPANIDNRHCSKPPKWAFWPSYSTIRTIAHQ